MDYLNFLPLQVAMQANLSSNTYGGSSDTKILIALVITLNLFFGAYLGVIFLLKYLSKAFKEYYKTNALLVSLSGFSIGVIFSIDLISLIGFITYLISRIL